MFKTFNFLARNSYRDKTSVSLPLQLPSRAYLSPLSRLGLPDVKGRGTSVVSFQINPFGQISWVTKLDSPNGGRDWPAADKSRLQESLIMLVLKCSPFSMRRRFGDIDSFYHKWNILTYSTTGDVTTVYCRIVLPSFVIK